MSDRTQRLDLTPTLLLRAYAAGVFPMAESAESDEILWIDPELRGIIPLDRFHVPKSLAKRMRRGDDEVKVDRDFAGVIDGCAARESTWINPEIRRLYIALHRMGYAHSVEVWRDGRLVGGLYGVKLGAAFFGESMFSHRRDASKIALAFLVDRLRQTGFTLFDTQFLTDHLATLGAVEIPRQAYHKLLAEALGHTADIGAMDLETDPQAVLQRITQTS